MHKRFLSTAAILGAISVALGAFGAHGLKKILDPDQLLVFETAIRYQFYHVFALLATGILYKAFPGKALLWAGRLFLLGILLFSGPTMGLRLMEAVRTADVASVPGLLEIAVPTAFVAAETAQVSNGGSVPRLSAAFAAGDPDTDAASRCVLVTDDDGWAIALSDALAARGVAVTTADAGADDFAAAVAAVDVAAGDGPVDAIVVARTGAGATTPGAAGADWQAVLDAHTGITDAPYYSKPCHRTGVRQSCRPIGKEYEASQVNDLALAKIRRGIAAFGAVLAASFR